MHETIWHKGFAKHCEPLGLARAFKKGHTMKKLLFLITLTFFSVGALTQAFAAPARNAAAGGGFRLKRQRQKPPKRPAKAPSKL